METEEDPKGMVAVEVPGDSRLPVFPICIVPATKAPVCSPLSHKPVYARRRVFIIW